MSFIAPILPDNAPFSPLQRAWLDGYLAALFGNDTAASASPADAMQQPGPPPPGDENLPWHDPTLPLDERLALADARPLQQQLMAAMGQLDCGQCGYLCQSYAEAVWSGDEADMGRCVPGGKETQRKVKELVVALEPMRDGSAVAAPSVKPTGQVGFSRDRPALATL